MPLGEAEDGIDAEVDEFQRVKRLSSAMRELRQQRAGRSQDFDGAESSIARRAMQDCAQQMADGAQHVGVPKGVGKTELQWLRPAIGLEGRGWEPSQEEWVALLLKVEELHEAKADVERELFDQVGCDGLTEPRDVISLLFACLAPLWNRAKMWDQFDQLGCNCLNEPGALTSLLFACLASSMEESMFAGPA